MYISPPSLVSSVGRAFDCRSKCHWFDSGTGDSRLHGVAGDASRKVRILYTQYIHRIYIAYIINTILTIIYFLFRFSSYSFMVGRRGKEYVYWLKMHGMEAPKWSYSVVVITRDFESRNLGSSPGRTFSLCVNGVVVTYNPSKVALGVRFPFNAVSLLTMFPQKMIFLHIKFM